MAVEFGDQVRAAFEAKASDLTVEFDKVFEAHHGQAESEVFGALRHMADEMNWHPSDEFLLPYAKVISGGQRVIFEYGNQQVS